MSDVSSCPIWNEAALICFPKFESQVFRCSLAWCCFLSPEHIVTSSLFWPWHREVNVKVAPHQMQQQALQAKRETLYYKMKWTDIQAHTHTHTHTQMMLYTCWRPTSFQMLSWNAATRCPTQYILMRRAQGKLVPCFSCTVKLMKLSAKDPCFLYSMQLCWGCWVETVGLFRQSAWRHVCLSTQHFFLQSTNHTNSLFPVKCDRCEQAQALLGVRWSSVLIWKCHHHFIRSNSRQLLWWLLFDLFIWKKWFCSHSQGTNDLHVCVTH